ncbi:MAG: hypothetical protein D6707_08500 [Bacteroidetes bacterium]|nr:MAG: hypothetical protein D6707_08500 [Bacteroidota bacterium]
MESYINRATHHTHEELEQLARLKKCMEVCASHSLYGESNNGLTYIGSHTCDNKNCHVCNYNRKKRIRRKLYHWFKNNKKLIYLPGREKTVTESQYKEKYLSEKGIKVGYDIMHLTLTVPHTEKGWKGTQTYYGEIMRAFNRLRNDEEIKQYIYGGEFGIETTRNENGLHIHIHALLLVKNCLQNRNELHRLILLKWNKLTVNPDIETKEFTKDRIKSIKKSNKLLTDEDIQTLSPQGATLIGLETIYTLNKQRKKVRSKKYGDKAMMIAVMETVSYHFKPLAMEEDGSLNYDLIAKIAAAIYRKPLYRKFGCWHGEKSLNIKTGTDPDAVLEDYADSVSVMKDEDTGVLIDGETGEIIDAGYKCYYITDASYIYHNPERELEPFISWKGRHRLIKINSISTPQALAEMTLLSVNKMLLRKSKEIKLKKYQLN